MDRLHISEKDFYAAKQLIEIAMIESRKELIADNTLVVGGCPRSKAISELTGCKMLNGEVSGEITGQFEIVFLFEEADEEVLKKILYEGAILIDVMDYGNDIPVVYDSLCSFKRIRVISLMDGVK